MSEFDPHTLSQIITEVERINLLLDEAEPKIRRANSNTQEQLRLLTASLTLMRRMGLPDEIDAAMMKVQRMISLLIQLRLAILAVEAASGPYGWALAGITAVGTILTAEDTIAGLAAP